jgi:DNA-directed RNA polymerase alpha subunit
MEYKLTPAGLERLTRIADRNALSVFTTIEALLLLADIGEWRLEAGTEQPTDPSLEARRNIPLAALTISSRLANALAALDYTSTYGAAKGREATVAELAAIPLAELMRARNLGKKSLKEWSDCLVKFGYPSLNV